MSFPLLPQVQLVLFALFVMSVQTELCDRLYLGGLDEKFVTYIQLGGKAMDIDLLALIIVSGLFEESGEL